MSLLGLFLLQVTESQLTQAQGLCCGKDVGKQRTEGRITFQYFSTEPAMAHSRCSEVFVGWVTGTRASGSEARSSGPPGLFFSIYFTDCFSLNFNSFISTSQAFSAAGELDSRHTHSSAISGEIFLSFQACRSLLRNLSPTPFGTDAYTWTSHFYIGKKAGSHVHPMANTCIGEVALLWSKFFWIIIELLW